MNQLQVYHGLETTSGLANANREKQKHRNGCDPVGTHNAPLPATCKRSTQPTGERSRYHSLTLKMANRRRKLAMSPDCFSHALNWGRQYFGTKRSHPWKYVSRLL